MKISWFHVQSYFDLANYTLIEKDGAEVVEDVNRILGEYFKKKQVTAN